MEGHLQHENTLLGTFVQVISLAKIYFSESLIIHVMNVLKVMEQFCLVSNIIFINYQESSTIQTAHMLNISNSSFRGYALFYLFLLHPDSELKTVPAASTQPSSIFYPLSAFMFFIFYSSDLSIFWSLLLETLTTRDTGLSYMRTNHPSLLLSHYTRCKRSAELTSMEGDLLRVVDQDPGLWFGRWR